MIDLAPTLCLCTRRHSADQKCLRLWFLVLASRGILSRTDQGGLMVAPALAVRAVAEIMAYEQENRPRPSPPALPDNSWVTLAVLAVFAGLSLWLDSRPGMAAAWVQAGQADARLIVGGQWWRCVTALGLHADAGHLLANLGTLAVMASLLARRLGSGLTWLLFVLTGALGNALNAWAQYPQHLSIGASTGVFGLIGIMAGSAGRRERGSRGITLLASFGFGLSFLALLGAGGERVDVGAHFFGLLCGLPLGLLVGGWYGTAGWRSVLSVVAGLTALTVSVGAWVLALS